MALDDTTKAVPTDACPLAFEGVDEVDRRRHLLDQGGQRRRSGLDLLQRLELVLDAGLGRRRGRGQVALGVGELLLVARDQGVDPVVGLVELVLVVGVEHHPAEAGADREGQYQAGDAENAAREDSGSEARGLARASGLGPARGRGRAGRSAVGPATRPQPVLGDRPGAAGRPTAAANRFVQGVGVTGFDVAIVSTVLRASPDQG